MIESANTSFDPSIPPNLSEVSTLLIELSPELAAISRNMGNELVNQLSVERYQSLPRVPFLDGVFEFVKIMLGTDELYDIPLQQ